MKIRFLILFFALALSSCQSKQAEKSNADSLRPSKASNSPSNELAHDFKFSFYISATGLASKPSDSWTMDTTGTMTIQTSIPISHGKTQEFNGLAVLDPRDMDSLRMLIRVGKLYEIDSNDLNQQCSDNEYYVLRIVPLASTPALYVRFDACAADYNLLLEPQRHYFRRFIDWWERMRVKYRPG